MVNLGADPAHQCVSEGGHLTQVDRRAIFYLAISLRYRRKNDVPLFHGWYSGLGTLISSMEYSGSSSP